MGVKIKVEVGRPSEPEVVIRLPMSEAKRLKDYIVDAALWDEHPSGKTARRVYSALHVAGIREEQP